ncbi:AAA family ATPase [Couchioplanes caeruleus]|uniref:AAA family ATPase n=1 Tax=Couchioplanes caeruleus TaxID=56438 RepID=UPI0020BE336B|nr:AAA family ATPase [Couchioplanes caeruleus]UQU66541.1 AAA family ATPase [Couchioplanes caeruleus]
MSKTDGVVVVAVCGSPGAGKTTVAAATAHHLGVPFLTRDAIKTGLALSAARVAENGTVHLGPDFHIAGGPLSRRAEAVMIDAARLLASSRVSFVVESSVLPKELLDALRDCQARVLALHVVADKAVIGNRLRGRASGGSAVDQQLAALFARGEMDPLIFRPPSGVDAVTTVDTSTGEEPPVQIIEQAFMTLLTSTRATGSQGPGRTPT